MSQQVVDLKAETIRVLNYYSKYYCRQYINCEQLFFEEKGHFALFNLLALFENIVKSTLNDFESSFYELNIRLKDENLINETELCFLNDNQISVRKIRNILAHANLSKYDLVINGDEVTYPFTENETCLIIYDSISYVLSRIILKVLKPLMDFEEIDLPNQIPALDFSLITRTPEELMAFKGITLNEEWDNLDEASKYRLVENSPDVNILTNIFKNLRL